MTNDPRQRPRATTPAELEAYLKRKNSNGGHDPEPEGLVEAFRRVVNQMTFTHRQAAKLIVREQLFRIKDHSSDPVSQGGIEEALESRFNKIVAGGLSGAAEAYKVLLSQRLPKPI